MHCRDGALNRERVDARQVYDKNELVACLTCILFTACIFPSDMIHLKEKKTQNRRDDHRWTENSQNTIPQISRAIYLPILTGLNYIGVKRGC